MVPSWFQEGPGPMSPTAFGGFLGPLRVSKIDQKSILDPKWESQGSQFIDFWGIPHCHQLFHRFFLVFWPKNRCFFCWFFVALLLFFSTWRPSRYIVIYRSKWSFSFFQILIFFEKMIKNPVKKTHPKKYPKMTTWGPLWDLKTTMNWTIQIQKSPKCLQKISFWGFHFLMFFWVAKKVWKKVGGWVSPEPAL